MSEHQCFMLIPTNRAARWLRRFLSAQTVNVRLCEPNGYHNAMFRIEDGTIIENADGSIHTDPLQWPDEDPRWTKTCDHCSYEFHENEVKQLFYTRIYQTPDGQDATIHSDSLPGIKAAPPGAMWYSDWWPEKGPDGHCLSVMTPGGSWMIDGPSNNGDGWTRTGVPPNVTANPSIMVSNRYHGWLRNGKLIEC